MSDFATRIARLGQARRVTALAAILLLVVAAGGPAGAGGPVGALTPAPSSPDRPASCITPTAHRTLYVEELPPAPDGSPRLGYGTTPSTASIPGPTLVMTEGDCLAITVVNDVRAETLSAMRMDPSLPLGVSLHVHGVKYTPASDGTLHNNSFVPPGESRTFIWYAAPRVTVADRVVSLGTAGYWWYHDYVVGTDHGTGGVGAGLFGAVVVRRPGDPEPDRTFVVPMGPGVSMGLLRHPAVPEYVARRGERVEFVVIGLGDGFHTFHVHGHNWADNRTGMLNGPADDTALIDNRTIGPADTFGFQVIAGEEVGPGSWMLHCHVQSHSDTGMMTFFRVTDGSDDGSPPVPHQHHGEHG
jgi:FtsP/CotA-like multicopper oxidase with cupredoxin domain